MDVTLSIDELSKVAHALSDPLRVRILDLVARGRTAIDAPSPVSCCPDGVCVCEIQEALDLAQSKVSYHLRELREAGLVHEQRIGKWNFYALNAPVLKAFLETLEERYLAPYENTERNGKKGEPA